DIPTDGDEARPPVQGAPVVNADDVRLVARQRDADRRRADIRRVTAQSDEAGPGAIRAGGVVDPERVVGADGEDLRLARGVEAGADLLDVAAQGDEPDASVHLDVVVFADDVDRVVHRGADLLRVAPQGDVDGAGAADDEHGVVGAGAEDLRVARGVGAGADLLRVAAHAAHGEEAGAGAAVDVDPIIFADDI